MLLLTRRLFMASALAGPRLARALAASHQPVMASVGGFTGERLRRNISQWLKTYDIHRYVGLIETGKGTDSGLFAGRWLEASMLACEWSGDALLRQRTSGMLDRILGAQQPGSGDPFPTMKNLADVGAMVSALETADELWGNGPAAAAADRLRRHNPDAFRGNHPGSILEMANLESLCARLGWNTAGSEHEIETVLWNRILPCQSVEGDGFRGEAPFNGWVSVADFRGERAGTAGALLLASVPWWLYSAGDGVVSVNLFGPSELRTEVGGHGVTLRQETSYPDGDTVTLVVEPDQPVVFQVRLRIPSWCAEPQLQLAGTRLAVDATAGFVEIRRQWKHGDRIELRLPMEATWLEGSDRYRNRVGLRRGPRFYALDAGQFGETLVDELRGERVPLDRLCVIGKELRPRGTGYEIAVRFDSRHSTRALLLPLASPRTPATDRGGIPYGVWLRMA